MKNYCSRSSLASKKVIPQRTCYHSIGWPNSWIIWKQQLHTWGFYWFVQGLFCTIDHAISLKKLENYEIKGTNLAWFTSYLTNRKEYIQMTSDSKIDLRNTTCGVPQVSILGSLLFLAYVNDLPFSSKISNPTMFTHNKNLFYEHKNIIKLFVT